MGNYQGLKKEETRNEYVKGNPWEDDNE